MTVATIVQARMTSTRLPGKVLAPVMGRPLLAYQIERLQWSQLADVLVIATTTESTDDPVAELAASMGALVFRGSEDDVLDRYLGAARMVDADLIVRVTADCPLIDPAIVDRTIAFHIDGGYDWSAPEDLPDGMGMNLMTRRLLEVMAAEATDPEDREHVTLYAIRRPTRFRAGHMRQDTDRSALRWTVDEALDLELVRTIFEYLYPLTPRFDYEAILWAFSGHPEWREINARVQGKEVDLSPVPA